MDVLGCIEEDAMVVNLIDVVFIFCDVGLDRGIKAKALSIKSTQRRALRMPSIIVPADD